jgi:ribosomal protein L37E
MKPSKGNNMGKRCKRCDSYYYNKGLLICGYCKYCAEERITELEAENVELKETIAEYVKMKE